MPVLNLHEVFKSKLTNSQIQAVELLSEFLISEEKCFILKGYAGTGKTFILNGIADYLNALSVDFGIMAPTGRAAQVVAKKSGFAASTIHRYIYAMDKKKEYVKVNDKGLLSKGICTEIRDNRTLGAVYLIDEASMISDNYSENDYFRYGSGYLLKDLIEFSKLDYNKIIFIGDSAQLPPVNSEISPALNIEYLKKFYKLDASEFEMTDVVRQDEESGILENATEIRNSIRKGEYDYVNFDSSYEDIQTIKKPDLLDAYSEYCDDTVNKDNIIIAYSNRTVQYYNELIRQKYFPGKEDVVEGDRILLVQNNYNHNIDLMNGELGDVIWAEEFTEDVTVPVYYDKEQYYVPLSYRNVALEFIDSSGFPREVQCKIIDNLMKSPERDLSVIESRALFIDFKRRHPYIKRDSEEYQEYIRSDPYLNCLKVKFGYAITCHKSQGGEWKNVFIDFSSRNGYNNQNYFRWAYTAITRSSKKIIAVNPPYNRNYVPEYKEVKPALGKDFELKGDLIIIHSEYDISQLPDYVDKNSTFLIYLYLALKDLFASLGLEVGNIIRFPFCERYIVKKDGSQAQLNIWYSKEFRINSANILRDKNSDHDFPYQELSKALNSLTFKTIVHDIDING